MKAIKTFKSISLLFLSLFAITATAADTAKPYSPDTFNHAQHQGKMIVVDVYKNGCGTCAKQKPTLQSAQEMYPNAEFFRVNFAADKEAVKRFRAIKQSTIIVYKGTEERGRSMGETNREKLLDLIAKGSS